MIKRIMYRAFTCGALLPLLVSSMAYAGSQTPSPDSWSRMSAIASGETRFNVIYRKSPGSREASRLEGRGGKVKRVFHLIPAVTVEVPQENLIETLTALADDPDVFLVEPDLRDHHIAAQTVPWGVERIGAVEVHAAGIWGLGVKVAVLDTGMDYHHPDLEDSYRGGYDFVNMDSDPMDDNGHGTHVSGTIAAVDNNIGVLGVAPAVSLYAVKTVAADGYGSHSDFIAGLEWCLDHGIKVVNYSAGSPTSSLALYYACKAAYQGGITIVAAAGNEGAGRILYPAAYSYVLAVGAISSSNRRASFSNYGPDLDLVAPGVDILSTLLGGGYEMWMGTSMAAPHVSGAAALLVKQGYVTPSDIFQRLKENAVDLGPAGPDDFYGYGLVSAPASVFHQDFLVSPIGGEILASGSTWPVQWQIPTGAVSFDLDFSINNGRVWYSVAQGVPGTSHDWPVPVPSSNRWRCLYRLKARDGNGLLKAMDESDKPFAIEVVKLLTPAPGERLAGGSVYEITWSINQTIRPVSTITLDATFNGGVTWRRLAFLPGDAASYLWQVPSFVRKKRRCLVRLILRDEAGVKVGRDSGDGFFVILPPLP